MTDSEKARAYDEALEKARKRVITEPQDHTDEILKGIFPELRESEDERIRKYLIEELKVAKSVGELKFIIPQPTREECIAYLEKQKEQKEETLRDFIDNFPYSAEQEEKEEKPSKPEFKIPEWVQGDWDDEYMINTVIGRYSLHAEVAKKHGDTHDYNLSKSMENWLRNVVKPLILEKEKEQKPTDDKAFEEWIDDWWKHNKVNNPNSYNKGDEIQFDEKGFKNFCRGIRNMYAEQKPIVTHGETYHVDTLGTQQVIAGKMPQKPAEWSEEDEDFINMLILHFNYLIDKGGDSVETYKSYIKKLKSLRPSWKPSEEQIYSLGTVVKGYNECTVGSVGYHLKEMYEQLKKLM